MDTGGSMIKYLIIMPLIILCGCAKIQSGIIPFHGQNLTNWILTGDKSSILRSKNTNFIYLTFDTESMDDADKICDILEKKNIKATFFMDNIWSHHFRIYSMNRTNLVNRISQNGIVGSHTVKHYNLQRMCHNVRTNEKITNLGWQLWGMEKIYNNVTSKTLEKIWRAPYLAYSERVIHFMNESGYVHVYPSLDSIDWVCFNDEKTGGNWDKSYNRLKRVRGGDIILVHLGLEYPSTNHVKLIDWFTDYALSKGYKFEVIRRKDIK